MSNRKAKARNCDAGGAKVQRQGRRDGVVDDVAEYDRLADRQQGAFPRELPLLGNQARSTSKTDNKTELLVFLTLRVVQIPEEARRPRGMILPAHKPVGGTDQK